MDTKITSTDLQVAFYKDQSHKYEFVVPNVFLRFDYELDLLCLRQSGYIDEIEIKVSKSDFLADFKKLSRVMDKQGITRSAKKHQALSEGLLPANRFSFLMPEELADQCKIPDYAGLYVLTKRGRIKLVKKAPLLHKRKISDKLKYKTARKMVFRYWQVLLGHNVR